MSVMRPAMEAYRPIDSALPNGFQVQIDPRCARGDDLRYLVGGSPTRMLRMSDAALGMTSADGRIAVCDPATRVLARTLLEAGIAHPRPMTGPRPEDVTVVIPVRDNQSGVDRLVKALPGLRIVIVDDASAIPVQAHRVGVEVIRFDTNRGPAAARNAGAAVVTTDFVAFLDSDVVPRPDWLTMLLAHFSDPLVALAAPRIVGLGAQGRLSPGARMSLAERYENSHSSLDMGSQESAVVPGTSTPYVPSAAIIVRRSAFSGFDDELRVAEDVDLCWRLHEAGWRIRYDPVARVAHDHRTGVWQVLARRRYYGTGGAVLAQRHGTTAAPVMMTVSMAVAVVALLSRTRIGAAIAAVVLTRVAIRLRARLGELPDAGWAATQMTARAAGYGILQAAGALCRHYWPLAVIASLGSRRFRRLVIWTACIEGLVEWVRLIVSDPALGSAIDPLTYTAFRRLDDLAYGLGLWEGVVRQRHIGALRPVITR